MKRYGAIYSDPPWAFKTWSENGMDRSAEQHYSTMTIDDIKALPVKDWSADDCVLFIWIVWPMLPEALEVIKAWGFEYKTCGFSWIKADARQPDMFRDDITPYMGMGYWTRSNSEVCLLATKGNPKRLDAGVRQAIVEPKREHSRKPDCVYERIERLVEGPYLEMFARQQKPGWDVFGNQTDKFSYKEAV